MVGKELNITHLKTRAFTISDFHYMIIMAKRNYDDNDFISVEIFFGKKCYQSNIFPKYIYIFFCFTMDRILQPTMLECHFLNITVIVNDDILRHPYSRPCVPIYSVVRCLFFSIYCYLLLPQTENNPIQC